MDNTALVIKLQNYIDICFRDALMTEGRSPESKYEVRWVLVKNPEGKWQFKVLKLYCQYEKVRRRAMYRLQKNLEKNFVKNLHRYIIMYKTKRYLSFKGTSLNLLLMLYFKFSVP